MGLDGIPSRVNALRQRYTGRDERAAEVQAIRRGNFEDIAPDLFNDNFKKPIVANLVDTAARDTAAVLAPLPSFNCSSATGLSERGRTFADKRTKIMRNYLKESNFELQMLRGADQYNSYGMLVMKIVPDFDMRMPRILVVDAVGFYPVWNMYGETVEAARVYFRDWFGLLADYPQLQNLKDRFPGAVANNKIEVVEYVSKTRVVTYLPKMGDTPLEDFPNPCGKCYYIAIQRPGLDDEIRGAYDDVIWVQLARHRLQLLLMEGIAKAVQAPTVVTPDVTEIPYGPDAVMVAQQGAQSIGRVRLDMPQQAFGAVEQLKEEQRVGSMNPESRSGSMPQSQITGRGVQELMVGFSSQIAAAQVAFKAGFRWMAALTFYMDEELFGDESKEIRGNDNGVPYSFTYKPRKDINGDHTVDISYGFAAGLDPNRALVFLLQADGAGLVSKDYVRRNLPVDLNAVDEEKKIVVEQSRLALVQGFGALAQSVPQLVAAGQDPTNIIQNFAAFIKEVEGGGNVEDAALRVLKPQPAPGASSPPEAATPPGPGGSAPGGAPPGDGTEMQGGQLVAAGPQAQGRPDLQQLFAGLSGSGAPSLQAGVARRMPTG
jgi:hypothetical protein